MKTAYVSELAYDELKLWLVSEGYCLCQLREGDKPYPSISSHPDIRMCDFKGKLIKNDIVSDAYPEYLGYNAVVLDRYLIHNLKYTSDVLLQMAEAEGMIPIHVKQGYTKCSCVVVDGRSIITADEGISARLRDFPDIDVLQIRPGYVRLQGFDYGFLGGASGKVGRYVVFNGDLEQHPDCEAIRRFISDRGLETVDFKGRELYDIGSIFVNEKME